MDVPLGIELENNMFVGIDSGGHFKNGPVNRPEAIVILILCHRIEMAVLHRYDEGDKVGTVAAQKFVPFRWNFGSALRINAPKSGAHECETCRPAIQNLLELHGGFVSQAAIGLELRPAKWTQSHPLTGEVDLQNAVGRPHLGPEAFGLEITRKEGEIINRDLSCSRLLRRGLPKASLKQG